jgi:hypothetical protein
VDSYVEPFLVLINRNRGLVVREVLSIWWYLEEDLRAKFIMVDPGEWQGRWWSRGRKKCVWDSRLEVKERGGIFLASERLGYGTIGHVPTTRVSKLDLEPRFLNRRWVERIMTCAVPLVSHPPQCPMNLFCLCLTNVWANHSYCKCAYLPSLTDAAPTLPHTLRT